LFGSREPNIALHGVSIEYPLSLESPPLEELKGYLEQNGRRGAGYLEVNLLFQGGCKNGETERKICREQETCDITKNLKPG
jgi:hypothetical protein